MIIDSQSKENLIIEIAYTPKGCLFYPRFLHLYKIENLFPVFNSYKECYDYIAIFRDKYKNLIYDIDKSYRKGEYGFSKFKIDFVLNIITFCDKSFKFTEEKLILFLNSWLKKGFADSTLHYLLMDQFKV